MSYETDLKSNYKNVAARLGMIGRKQFIPVPVKPVPPPLPEYVGPLVLKYLGPVVEYEEQHGPLLSPRAKLISLLAQVARKYGVTPEDIKGKGRTARVVSARHEYWFEAISRFKWNLCDLQNRTGSDHTTIMSGIRCHSRNNGVPLPGGYSPRGHSRFGKKPGKHKIERLRKPRVLKRDDHNYRMQLPGIAPRFD